jgi:hypothetical protein
MRTSDNHRRVQKSEVGSGARRVSRREEEKGDDNKRGNNFNDLHNIINDTDDRTMSA